MQLRKIVKKLDRVKCRDCPTIITKKVSNQVRCLPCSNKKQGNYSKPKSQEHKHECHNCKESFVNRFKHSKFCGIMCKKIYANKKSNSKWV